MCEVKEEVQTQTRNEFVIMSIFRYSVATFQKMYLNRKLPVRLNSQANTTMKNEVIFVENKDILNQLGIVKADFEDVMCVKN